jgi:hypothetical protein
MTDGGTCVLDFTSGAIGTLHLADGDSASQPFERYTFFGTGRHVSIENGRRVTFQRGIPYDYRTTKSFAPRGRDSGAVTWEAQDSLATLDASSLFTQGFVPELEYFCSCSQRRIAPEHATLEFAQHVLDVYEAALISDRTPVDIPDRREP